jgi:Trypsin-like peptidase domain
MKGTVIQVGDGRGFVIATKEARYVVTAAHCLPNLPPADPAAYTEERTYRDFLGPLGARRDVWAECVFANPVADLAVLAQPDGQELSDRADAYDKLIEAATPFTVGKLQSPRRQRGLPGDPASSDARMLSLDGKWFACRITSFGLVLWVEAAAQPIKGGMSGSPVILPDGVAVAVLCTGNQRNDGANAPLDTGAGGTGGPNPMLFDQLPAWLARAAF